ncbi:MAG TPA: hypothetical protein VL742_11815 [Casimicrobiaceae bacterium]|nr:hypothetical protein [Casimicrobiaceae bacterium]
MEVVNHRGNEVGPQMDEAAGLRSRFVVLPPTLQLTYSDTADDSLHLFRIAHRDAGR